MNAFQQPFLWHIQKIWSFFVAPNSRPRKPVKPKKEFFCWTTPECTLSPFQKSSRYYKASLCCIFILTHTVFKLNPKQYCSILDSLIAQGVLPRCDHAKEKNQRNPGFRKSGHNPLKTSDWCHVFIQKSLLMGLVLDWLQEDVYFRMILHVYMCSYMCMLTKNQDCIKTRSFESDPW